MSYLKTLAKETVIYGGSSILARALQFVLLTPYLTRKLVNLDYGRHAIYYAFAAVLIILFTFRRFSDLAIKKHHWNAVFLQAPYFCFFYL